MSDHLDMSLDEIIRNRKNQAAAGARNKRPTGFGSDSGPGPGPDRFSANRQPFRTHPYQMPPPMPMPEPMMARFGRLRGDSVTKLYVSNLDYGVTDADIVLLFSDVGEMRSCSLHYDRSGNSKGTAEVVFFHQNDALAAIRRYNNANLDGKPVKIEVVGAHLPYPAPSPALASMAGYPRAHGTFGSGQQKIAARAHAHNGGFATTQVRAGVREVTRGQGEEAGWEKKTAEELDDELDKYRKEATKLR